MPRVLLIDCIRCRLNWMAWSVLLGGGWRPSREAQERLHQPLVCCPLRWRIGICNAAYATFWPREIRAPIELLAKATWEKVKKEKVKKQKVRKLNPPLRPKLWGSRS